MPNICFKIKKKNKIVIFSTLDNLVKGAAGQAIQNMNLLFNFKENLGLNENCNFFLILISSCTKSKSVLICGDHVCINKAEAKKYFEENLEIEVKIVSENKKRDMIWFKWILTMIKKLKFLKIKIINL